MQRMNSSPRQRRRRAEKQDEAKCRDASLAASSRRQQEQYTSKSSCYNRKRNRCSTKAAAAAAVTLLSCRRHVGGASAFIATLRYSPFTTTTSTSTITTTTAVTQQRRPPHTMSVVPGFNNDILRTATGSPDTHTPATATPTPTGVSSTSTHQQQLPELNHDEVRRYSRHLILPDVGVRGQRTLKASSVLAVGTGGLGSPALLYLAAAGVGRLGVLDDDVVDESNLQRQVLTAVSVAWGVGCAWEVGVFEGGQRRVLATMELPFCVTWYRMPTQYSAVECVVGGAVWFASLPIRR